MDFSKNYILENDIVLLRPLTMEDYELLLPFSIHEPTLWEYSLIPASSPELLKKYMEAAIEDREKGLSYPFIVFDKRVNQIAGSTRFYDYQRGHNTVQLGFTWYGKAFQGTGLNKPCKYLMLEFAFQEMGVDRVEFRADNNNKRSIAAMKSLGCVEEGVLRNNCKSLTGRRDSIVLSILREEWDGGVEERLKARI